MQHVSRWVVSWMSVGGYSRMWLHSSNLTQTQQVAESLVNTSVMNKHIALLGLLTLLAQTIHSRTLYVINNDAFQSPYNGKHELKQSMYELL